MEPQLSTIGAVTGERRYRLLIMLSILAGLAAVLMILTITRAAFAQETVFVEATPANTFVPADVTIFVGDTVQWDNTGGFHDVEAVDGSFDSGAPSSDPWTFSHVFDTPGTFDYFCEVQVGIGMVGTVTVVPAPTTTTTEPPRG